MGEKLGSPIALPLASLLALTALVYWPGLNGPLILDDVSNLDVLRRLSEQQQLSLENVLAERGGILGGRPVSWISFLMNWYASGADVWSFKLVNLVIHLVNGILVLMLGRCLLPEPAAASVRTRDWCALIVCGFWLLTPIQVSTVLYVVQRMALLSALFSLAGLVVYCHGRMNLAHRPRAGMALMASALLVFWPLAALSKQNGALLVPLLLVVEILFFAPRDSTRWPRFVLLAITAVLLGAGCVRMALDPQWVLDTYPLRDFTLEQRLLTQPRVLVDYILNILQLPGGSSLGLFHDDFPASTSFLSPPETGLAILLVIAVPLLAWRLRSRNVGVVLLGLTFFLVAHSLESGPFGLEMYFEHRNYLPSFGIWLSVLAAVLLVLDRVSRPRMVFGIALVLLAGHGVLSATRVSVWERFDGIIEASVTGHPGSGRTRAGAAIVAFTEGRLEEGLTHLEAVRTLSGPRAALPVALKSFVGYCLAGRSPNGELTTQFGFIKQLVADPYLVAALRWYRTVTTGRECPGLDTARVAARLEELAREPQDGRNFGLQWLLNDELAWLLAAHGRHEAASRHLRLALGEAPRSRRPGMEARLRTLSGR